MGMSIGDSCPDDATLDRLHAGELEAAEMATLAGHLDNCPTCGERLHSRFLASQSGVGRAGTMDSLRDRFASDKNQTDRLPDWLTRLLAHGPEMATPELSRGLEHGDLGSLGRYRVIRVLGEGASSVVYQGFDPELERLVVLKAFRPDYATGATGLKDMMEEARAFARVQDDHVMLVHEVARAGNTLFLVMPYQEGETLEVFLRNLRASNGKLSRHESLDLALQAALGLRAIHNRDLLHGDLKPSNAWVFTVDGGRRLALLDLGLATRRQGRSPGPYLAPEAARGPSTRASDLFALGRLTDDLCRAGDRPWPGSVTRQVAAMMADDPARRPDLDGWIHLLRGELNRLAAGGRAGRMVALAGFLCLAGMAVLIAGFLLPGHPEIPRGLAPVRVWGEPAGVRISLPLLEVAPDGSFVKIKKDLGGVDLVAPDGTVRQIGMAGGIIKAAWKPPYLALINNQGVLMVLDTGSPSGKPLLETNWASSVPTGLGWSGTDPTRLILGRGNEAQVYRLDKAGTPAAALVLESEVDKVAPPWLTPHTPVWIGWEPGRLQVNAIMPPGGMVSTNLVDAPLFSFRPVNRAPAMVAWSPDGERFLVASQGGELERFNRKIALQEGLYPLATLERGVETGLEIAELVWGGPDWAAIRLHGGKREILLVNPETLRLSAVPLDTAGKRVIRITAEPGTRHLHALADDGTVLKYQLPENPVPEPLAP